MVNGIGSGLGTLVDDVLKIRSPRWDARTLTEPHKVEALGKHRSGLVKLVVRHKGANAGVIQDVGELRQSKTCVQGNPHQPRVREGDVHLGVQDAVLCKHTDSIPGAKTGCA